MGARRFVTDAEFGRSGSQSFSCDEMERYSGLSWRQAKVASQPIDGLVHDKAPFKTARLLVAVPSPEDLSLCAKHLLSEATIAREAEPRLKYDQGGQRGQEAAPF